MSIRLKVTAFLAATALAAALTPVGLALADEPVLSVGEIAADTEGGESTDSESEPGTDPGAEPGTDPGTDSGTEPGTDPGTEPGTEPTPSTDPDPMPAPVPDPEPTPTPTPAPVVHADGWEKSGNTWRYWKDNAQVKGQWVVTKTAPDIVGAETGKHRYWIAKDGTLARKRLIDPSTKRDRDAGYYAYATKYGYVAVGKKSVGNKVYLAKANGELETGDSVGMLDSSKYDSNGTMRRYFIDKKAHAAITGKIVQVKGFGQVYAYPKKGHIARGVTKFDKAHLLLADSDGRLLQKAGWVDTDAYAGKTQRYYLEPTNKNAKVLGARRGLFEVKGWGAAYAYPKTGAVARGVKKFDKAHLLLADSDGRLLQKAGWVDTDAYAGKTQRYYLEPTTRDKSVLGARRGLFTVKGWGNAYAYPKAGYIVRGVKKFDDAHLLLADSDGRLLQKAGWVDTDAYAGSSQRYYLEPTARDKGVLGARRGLFTVKGWGNAYAHPTTGYIVRGVKKFDSTHVLLADGEGRLRQKAGWVNTDAYGNGMQRYYLEPTTRHSNVNGARTGMFSIGGMDYSADSTGAIFRNGRKVIDSVYYNADENGALWRDDVITRMYREAQDYWSPSQYLLMVDTDDTKTIVFEGSQGNWNIKFIWDCSTGAPETPTVLGTFQVGLKGYSFGEDHGYSCYYWTQFYGDYLFHTRIYWANTHNLRDVSMNTRVSQGCVRLYDEDAKWIWDNVPTGTTVVTLE